MTVRTLVIGLAAGVALLTSGAAHADQESCKTFRDDIVKMEDRSVRPPGWFGFDQYLRTIYKSYCIDSPTRKRAIEYWYRTDGTSTGVKTDDPNGRPKDAAYATTKEIGDFCLFMAESMTTNVRGAPVRAGLDPGICALQRGALAACAAPMIPKVAENCSLILGLDIKVAPIPKGDALPPIAIGLDGGPYVLNEACQRVLGAFADDLALDESGAANRGDWRDTMQANCPDFLAAIERRAGAKVNAPGFWPAFGQLLLNGFPTAQQQQRQPQTLGGITKDPGFQRVCAEAETNRNKCQARLEGMRSVGTVDTGTKGQAGEFHQCTILYGQVLNMCGKANRQAERVAAIAATKVTPPPPKPQPQPQPKGNAQSRPLPASLGMSAACKAQLNQLMEAADRNDSQRATELYGAMRSGCDQAMRGLSTDVDMALPERKPGDLSKRYFGCPRGQDCGVAPSTPEQMAQAAANAVYPEDVMRFVFAVAGFAIGVAGYYTPVQSGYIVRSPQFSTMNQRVRSTYGQGGPVYSTPRQRPSDLQLPRR